MCPSACLPCLFLAPGAQFSCDALAAGRTKRPQCLPDVGWEQGIQHRCQNHPGEEMKAASATQTPRGLQEERVWGLKTPKKASKPGCGAHTPARGARRGSLNVELNVKRHRCANAHLLGESRIRFPERWGCCTRIFACPEPRGRPLGRVARPWLRFGARRGKFGARQSRAKGAHGAGARRELLGGALGSPLGFVYSSPVSVS